MDVKLNDWVTGYSKGFFKIIKIFPIYYDESCYDIHEHKVGEENHNSIVVLKKGFNTNMKPTLGWDSCAVSYCNRVDNKVLNEIDSVFLTNEKFKTKFDAYEIPRMQLIHNMNIVIKNDKDKDNILKIISYINEGHTYIEIIKKLNSYGILKSKFSDDNLLQFICYDYEVDKNKRKIYREARITYR